RQPGDLLRRLVRVRQGNDAAQNLAHRLQEKPFAVDALEHRPAHLVSAHSLALADESRVVVIAEALHAHRHARVHDTDDLAKALAVALDRLLIGFARGSIELPVLRSLLDRLLDLPLD